jgi:hypothetical protein
VPTLVMLLRTIGALPWPGLGSSRGCTVAVALTQTGPTSMVIAYADAQTPPARIAARTATLRYGALRSDPLAPLEQGTLEKGAVFEAELPLCL